MKAIECFSTRNVILFLMGIILGSAGFVVAQSTSMNVDADLNVKKNAVIGMNGEGDLTVENDALIKGDLTLQGTVSQDLTVDSNVIAGGNVTGNKAIFGEDATASGSSAGVVGAKSSSADGDYSFVGGGTANHATGDYSAIVGGDQNTASGDKSLAGAGILNQATGVATVVLGGSSNGAGGSKAVAIGGSFNRASASSSVAIGGGGHLISGSNDEGNHSVAIGGSENRIYGAYGVVVGGVYNQAFSYESVIIGGEGNHSSGVAAAVLGGSANKTAGDHALVCGGSGNIADGDYSLAAGRFMQVSSDADHSVAFGYSPTNITITQPDSFVVHNLNMGVGVVDPEERLDVDGAIKLRVMASPPSGTGDPVLFAKDDNGTARLYGRDESLNTTLLSSHMNPREKNAQAVSSFDDQSVVLPFSFHHSNSLVGKGVVVDMAGVIAELERMSGKSFTTIYDLPPEDVMSVPDWTEAERSRREKEAKKERLAMLPDVEIPISEAWQEIPEVEIRSVTATETTYRYDFEEMRVISETKQRVRPEEVVTGRRIKRLKSGVRFDEKTGKFCRRPSLNEVEITPVPTPALPDWVLSRVPEERR